MKNIFLKIFISISLIAGISSCGLFQKGKVLGCGQNGETEQELVMRSYSAVINSTQLDSLCATDNLNRDLETWMKSEFNDYETSERIVKYMWVKYASKSNEVTYILIPVDTLYNFNKRVVNLK